MDLGQSKTTNRTVADYARTSAIPDFQAGLLFRLMEFFNPTDVLELGTNLGKSALSIKAGFEGANVVSVEGNQALHQYTLPLLSESSIESVNLSFEEFFSKDSRAYDLVFIDGNHNLNPTLHYFEELKKRLKSGGLMIFHDIYWSSGMKQAWTHIKADPDVKVTIDLFFMGLVWIDLPQEKQHFSVRFPENLGQLFR